ncbi:hypothetical protein Cch01nite_07700 [Cellulomonas chitinilytica]|uniref:Uncharacterized protein n=1 Tax=Cellulomonas chitinilytica TaxID=398759 RepID=A0A919U036_9CELL|nr:hypothetical protein [Cellulomonas chitinilytica]GIG20046.1 hypothetical protein Cch01nite_07700 [Cellulomonas chitinilytica]
MSRGKVEPTQELAADVGQALLAAAFQAFQRGQRFWSCSVTVATFVGAPIKATHGPTSVTRVSTDTLLEAVEKVGWHVEDVDHVYVQTTTSTNTGFAGMSVAGISGQIEAHYLFRRAT